MKKRKCFELDSKKIIKQTEFVPHTITFSLNDELQPYWKQLGYKSEKQYNDSLFWLDLETGKRYKF